MACFWMWQVLIGVGVVLRCDYEASRDNWLSLTFWNFEFFGSDIMLYCDDCE